MTAHQLNVTNEKYLDEMSEAILKAVYETAAKLGPPGVAVFLSGEIVRACLSTIAFAVSTSKVTATPRDTRLFCDALAKQLQSLIAATQKEFADNPLPRFTAINAEDRH